MALKQVSSRQMRIGDRGYYILCMIIALEEDIILELLELL